MDHDELVDPADWANELISQIEASTTAPDYTVTAAMYDEAIEIVTECDDPAEWKVAVITDLLEARAKCPYKLGN